MSDLSALIDKVEALCVRTHEDVRLASALRWIQQSLIEAEHMGKSSPQAEALVLASVGWCAAVARAIASALAYRTPQQRRTAMELAAEESEMRLIMSLEPARLEARGSEMSDELRGALADLAARIDVADRMLHARIMIAAAR